MELMRWQKEHAGDVRESADGERSQEKLAEARPSAVQSPGPPGDQPSHPTPSQIANSNKYKQSSPDHGKSGGKEHSQGKDEGYSM
jgi:hypothetical protein